MNLEPDKSQAAEDEGPFPPSSKTVMVVDDDDSVRDLLSTIVRNEGFKFDTAASGKAALKLLGTRAFDLLLLDLMLPNMGGFEVLRHLQSDLDTAKIPVIVVTGRYTEPSTMQMIRQEPNVVEFIEKPVKTELLVAAIHRVLNTVPKAVSDVQSKPKLEGW